ncbi:MAG: hypothetical protein IKR86_05025 [Candidatus Methanomethylophilaceae archaeon]|nr:hypothetical protein [Candidatus Methanomethylophilaceae archaeon]
MTSIPFHLKTIIMSSCWVISHPLDDTVSAAFPMSMSMGSAEMAMREVPPHRRAVVNLISGSPEALWPIL